MSRHTDNALRAQSREAPTVFCEGKQRFDSHALASKVFNRANRNSHGAKAYSAYRCTKCGGWHVGGSPIAAGRRRDNDLKKRRLEAKESIE